MYLVELEIKDATENITSASYPDVQLSIWRDGRLQVSINVKQDSNFNITSFPFLNTNWPSSSVYCVFISQFIQYVRACSSYECYILRDRRFQVSLRKENYLMEFLKSLFRKFHDRYGDLIQQYGVPLSWILNEILIFNQLQWPRNRSDFSPISWTVYKDISSPNYKWLHRSICNGCDIPAENAYPPGHLVSSRFLDWLMLLYLRQVFPKLPCISRFLTLNIHR